MAMEAYETRTEVGSKFKTEVADKPIHTWEDVLAEVERAEVVYSDASGAWGKIQKGLRKFGSNARAFEAWASLLPSESEYTSVLCGGLKLIFGVCISYISITSFAAVIFLIFSIGCCTFARSEIRHWRCLS